MKIEFLRLDLHLKRKQKKTTRAAPTCSSEKKEKKNPETKVFIREERRKKKKKNQKQSCGDLVSPRDLGCGATWVYHTQPMSSAWIWRSLGRLELISISSSVSFFFSFFLHFLPLFLHFGLHFGSLIFYFWVRNRVLETRFPCRRHLEKVPHQRRITHENRALEARFRSPKSRL